MTSNEGRAPGCLNQVPRRRVWQAKHVSPRLRSVLRVTDARPWRGLNDHDQPSSCDARSDADSPGQALPLTVDGTPINEETPVLQGFATDRDQRKMFMWSRWDSNPRPSHCERDALPTELRPRSHHTPDRRWIDRTGILSDRSSIGKCVVPRVSRSPVESTGCHPDARQHCDWQV